MLKRIVIPAVAGLLVATAGAGGSYAAMNDEVTVSIDGALRTERTLAPTVGDYLQQAGIEVGPRDEVTPALTEPISSDTEIGVRYGRELTLVIDGEPTTAWTTERELGAALTALGHPDSADVKPARSTGIPRDGLSATVGTEKTVTVVLKGKKTERSTTAHTVADLLAELDIEPSRDDKIKPAADETIADGATVTFVDVEKKTEKKTEEIDYDTVRVNNDELERGETEVTREGRKGEQELVFEVVLEDGKEVKRTETEKTVINEPRDERIDVGTKDPAPAPAPSAPEQDEAADTEDDSSDSDSSGGSSSGGSASGGSSSGGSSSGGSSSGDSGSTSTRSARSSGGGDAGVWDRLAQCESGGNWQINTGNGYYGGIQFSEATWRSMGGTGLPHQHSKAEQIRLGQKLQAAYGWGQWPACSAKLGLR